MSREIKKNFSIADLVREVRTEGGLSFTELAFRLGVSESAARHYEGGRRQPDALLLRRLADIAPEELRLQIEERLPNNLRGEIRVRLSGRRYKEETVLEAHAALDAILDNARSDIVEKVLAELTKFAGRFAESKE